MEAPKNQTHIDHVGTSIYVVEVTHQNLNKIKKYSPNQPRVGDWFIEEQVPHNESEIRYYGPFCSKLIALEFLNSKFGDSYELS
ncbi:hypothetical protein VMF7928_04474 [Vibrio marisflavi CECT 7928]|uniref:Uncharacterized protein n=2 Tax=Vibrio marisflavi TaxID=1216040 RepID=A0ABM9AAC5_9VIBR|nr:hypothetical protein VMF7928_04474 [Vibrio marisflavi CECT 7928]